MSNAPSDTSDMLKDKSANTAVATNTAKTAKTTETAETAETAEIKDDLADDFDKIKEALNKRSHQVNKLTRKLWRYYWTHNFSQVQIANTFGISQPTLSTIFKRLNIKVKEHYDSGKSFTKLSTRYSIPKDKIEYMINKISKNTPNPKTRKRAQNEGSASNVSAKKRSKHAPHGIRVDVPANEVRSYQAGESGRFSASIDQSTVSPARADEQGANQVIFVESDHEQDEVSAGNDDASEGCESISAGRKSENSDLSQASLERTVNCAEDNEVHAGLDDAIDLSAASPDGARYPADHSEEEANRRLIDKGSKSEESSDDTEGVILETQDPQSCEANDLMLDPRNTFNEAFLTSTLPSLLPEEVKSTCEAFNRLDNLAEQQNALTRVRKIGGIYNEEVDRLDLVRCWCWKQFDTD